MRWLRTLRPDGWLYGFACTVGGYFALALVEAWWR